jgi:predicted lipid-binding transport protein (Tim44 family)
MNDPFNPLNLLLLAFAAVILWRLKSVLGQRTGLEKPPIDTPQQRDNVVRLPTANTKANDPDEQETPVEAVWKNYAQEGSETALGLEKIAQSSNGFTVKSFIEGAKFAYELILEAFAKGDKQALKPLLSKDVMDSFTKAIDDRIKAGQTMTMQFVGVKSAAIELARMDGKRALVAVRFVGQMINAVVDKDGNTIEGDPTQVRDVEDVWTFERDVSSRDPNWKLVDTSDGVNT